MGRAIFFALSLLLASSVGPAAAMVHQRDASQAQAEAQRRTGARLGAATAKMGNTLRKALSAFLGRDYASKQPVGQQYALARDLLAREASFLRAQDELAADLMQGLFLPFMPAFPLLREAPQQAYILEASPSFATTGRSESVETVTRMDGEGNTVTSTRTCQDNFCRTTEEIERLGGPDGAQMVVVMQDPLAQVSAPVEASVKSPLRAENLRVEKDTENHTAPVSAMKNSAKQLADVLVELSEHPVGVMEQLIRSMPGFEDVPHLRLPPLPKWQGSSESIVTRYENVNGKTTRVSKICKSGEGCKEERVDMTEEEEEKENGTMPQARRHKHAAAEEAAAEQAALAEAWERSLFPLGLPEAGMLSPLLDDVASVPVPTVDTNADSYQTSYEWVNGRFKKVTRVCHAGKCTVQEGHGGGNIIGDIVGEAAKAVAGAQQAPVKKTLLLQKKPAKAAHTHFAPLPPAYAF